LFGWTLRFVTLRAVRTNKMGVWEGMVLKQSASGTLAVMLQD
jgi:hypothetical protein